VLVAGTGTTAWLSACTIFFPVGPRSTGSSINDWQLACIDAVNSGTPIRSVLTLLVNTYGPALLVPAMAYAGVKARQAIDSNLDVGSSNPPSTCPWNGSTAMFLCTDSNGNVTPVRPKSFPPAPDSTWEDGAVQQQELTSPSPPIDQLPEPDGTPKLSKSISPESYFSIGIDKCVETLTTVQTLADGSLTTLGAIAGVGSEDCGRKRIYSPGLELSYDPVPVLEVPATTSHRIAAILTNPLWLQLNYQNRTSKLAEIRLKGVGDPDHWYNRTVVCATPRPASQGCDEFPNLSTVQGAKVVDWTAGILVPTVSLQLLLSADNTREGGKFGNFVTGCGLTSGSESDPAPEGSDFLEIPTTVLPSWWACGA
jgi:hypothetical protein